MLQELGDILKQAAETGGVAAGFLVHAGAATIEERHREAGRAQFTAGVLVPASMALDAMQANDLGQRGSLSIRRRIYIAPILQAVAVRGLKGFDAKGGRLSQATAPCVKLRA